MARGGVYDQLAGGFHRYSVDERWCVPHFEKMSYDNSELLKNYLHGYQVTGIRFSAKPPKALSRWVSEVLSDPQHGGFYASQDADQTLDDDGDYFTWTLDELRAVLSPDECARHGTVLRRRRRMARCTTIPRKMFCGSRPRRRHRASSSALDEATVRLLIATRQGKLLAARRRAAPPRRRRNALRRLERHVRLRLS